MPDTTRPPGPASNRPGVPPTPAEGQNIREAADRALAGGHVVAVGGLLVVPDVIMAEGIANGYGEPPKTLMMVRADGRSVNIFQHRPVAR